MRAWAIMTLVAGLALVSPGVALPPVPYQEIVDTVHELAAHELGRKRSDLNTVDSLFAQGMSERQFAALITAIQNEFGVVIPDNEIQQGKWNDPVVRLSIRRLAQLVERQMRQSPPS
jgi:acyl carrier protein